MIVDFASWFGPSYSVEYDAKRVIPRIEEALESHDRLGDVILALEDMLKADPLRRETEHVMDIDGVSMRIVRTDPAWDAPGVSLVYWIDQDAEIIHVSAVRIETP
jgi:hypothetical protein